MVKALESHASPSFLVHSEQPHFPACREDSSSFAAGPQQADPRLEAQFGGPLLIRRSGGVLQNAAQSIAPVLKSSTSAMSGSIPIPSARAGTHDQGSNRDRRSLTDDDGGGRTDIDSRRIVDWHEARRGEQCSERIMVAVKDLIGSRKPREVPEVPWSAGSATGDL